MEEHRAASACPASIWAWYWMRWPIVDYLGSAVVGGRAEAAWLVRVDGLLLFRRRRLGDCVLVTLHPPTVACIPPRTPRGRLDLHPTVPLSTARLVTVLWLLDEMRTTPLVSLSDQMESSVCPHAVHLKFALGLW